MNSSTKQSKTSKENPEEELWAFDAKMEETSSSPPKKLLELGNEITEYDKQPKKLMLCMNMPSSRR